MERFTYLLNGYIQQTLTVAEKQELHLLMRNRDATEARLAASFEDTTEPVWDGLRETEMLQNVLEADVRELPAHRIHFFTTVWFRYAAVLLLIAGTATFLYWNHTSLEETDPFTLLEKTDIPPGGNKALLTLSDGSTIVLDNATNGALAQQGNTKISKLKEGALAYHVSGSTAHNNTGEVSYNTLSTPKGGVYQVSLPDGTKVWLNAASSITFPTAFGTERKVNITGEVYFEVAADKTKPFLVKAGSTAIQVLGTSFNVNAYKDESFIKTALLEGRVKIGEFILQPGQAFVEGKVISSNIEQDIAWKHGIFNFQNLSFPEAARQLERWYDIDVEYEGKIPSIQFKGDMDRGISLSGIIRLLSALGIEARIEGRKLIIM